MKESFKAKWYRGKYLIPNAVTVVAMFCGFLAIIYASSGRFHKAALAIIIAAIVDGLDGRVARKLNATSKFGGEFDSFSDVVSFGVAPAILLYEWCFKAQADEFGVLVTFLFALAAAIRLARFNIAPPNLHSFVGLSTTASAIVIASIVNCFPYPQLSQTAVVIGSIVMTTIAYLMVSTIEFYSIKKIKFSDINPPILAALGLIVGLVWWKGDYALLCLSLGYAFSGPVMLLKKVAAKSSIATELPEG